MFKCLFIMKNILIALLCFICFSSSAQQPVEKVFEHDPLLHGDSVVFPITLVNAFPFISGEVNGVKGKFMFDTGDQFAIEVNENLVKLPNKRNIGSGVVGSGQTYNVSINDTIKEVKFANGFIYHDLLKIKSGNYSYLEHITPDCIGYVGYDFFKGYTFKLDYLRRRITFYKNTPQRTASKDFLNGEKVLGVISFETRRLPNHPLVKVKIGKLELLGDFDTGQFGILKVTDSVKRDLLAKALISLAGTDSNDSDLTNIKSVTIGGGFKTGLKGVLIDTVQSPRVRKAIQITEPYVIDFGYRLLDQYKTVWDYDNKKIYILESK